MRCSPCRRPHHPPVPPGEVEAGQQVSMFRIDPGTGEMLGLLAKATVGEGGWADLGEPIIVRSGEAFSAAREG